MKTFFIFLIIGTTFLSSCVPQENTIKIGVIIPLSDAPFNAMETRNGINLAVSEVNQREILNTEIRIIWNDATCDIKDAEVAAFDLIVANGVRALISSICSEATETVARIAEQNNAILISLTPTDITSDFLFHLTTQNASQQLQLEEDPVFKELYKRVYNETPTPYSAKGYRSIKIIVDILKDTRYTGVQMKEALANS